jgi:N-sulfoglucosamine sulfohydrolase
MARRRCGRRIWTGLPRKAAEELYDLQADPWEIHNLATVPEHQETLKRMRGVLEKWIEDSNDQGRVAEQSDVNRKRRNAK